MKKIVTLALLCLITKAYVLHAQAIFPSPSPGQTVHQEFGVSAIDLSYSRPSVKQRKIFGDLIPFGQAWRTGANGPTSITFGDEVTINSVKIPAGKYGLVSIPGKDKWIFIITKQLNVTSSADYKKEDDIVRIESRPLSVKDKAETLTIQFENLSSTSCDLVLKWENTLVSFPISTSVDDKVLASIDRAMNEKDPPYFQSAYYYFSNGKDLNKAEIWAQKAVEADPDGYYIYYLLAQIQAAKGEKEKAIASANKSIEVSKQNHRDDYVSLNNKLIKSLK